MTRTPGAGPLDGGRAACAVVRQPASFARDDETADEFEVIVKEIEAEAEASSPPCKSEAALNPKLLLNSHKRRSSGEAEIPAAFSSLAEEAALEEERRFGELMDLEDVVDANPPGRRTGLGHWAGTSARLQRSYSAFSSQSWDRPGRNIQLRRSTSLASNREWDRQRSIFDPRTLRHSRSSGELSASSRPTGPLGRALRRAGSSLSSTKINALLSDTISSCSFPSIMSSSDQSYGSAGTPRAAPLFRRKCTSLDGWWSLVPDNSVLTTLFPEDTGRPITVLHILAVLVMVSCVTVLLLAVFSNLGTMERFLNRGFMVYQLVLRPAWWRWLAVALLVVGFALCYYCTCGTWRRSLVTAVGFISAVLLNFVAAMFAPAFPAAPLATASLVIPAALAKVRLTCARECGLRQFYTLGAVVLCVVAAAILAVWCTWVVQPHLFKDSSGSEDYWWGDDAPASMVTARQLDLIIASYASPSWQECAKVRLQGLTGFAREACHKVRMVVFLVWVSPVVITLWLVWLALACFCRAFLLTLDVTSRTFDFAVFGSALLLASYVFAFWTWASIAGTAMNGGIIAVLFACSAGVVLLAWALCSIRLVDVVALAERKEFMQAVKPLLVSDYFTSFLLCCVAVPLICFFLVEFLARQVQRLVCRDVSGHTWLTGRAVRLLTSIDSWHWGSIFENAVYWLWYFKLFTVIALQVAVVFFSWLNAKLVQVAALPAVAVTFYFAGLAALLIPAIPAVPVYVAAGIILVHSARYTAGIAYPAGIVLATAECLLLKVNALAIQRGVFGTLLGRSLWVQQNVGVHKVGIRAIESILREPGLALQKVVVLCGGPDWPTCVLTGILRLDLCQMVLGVLPVTVLITPCVVFGAFLTNEDFTGLASVALVLATSLQGGSMLLALLLVLHQVNKRYDELMMWRPELAEVVAYARRKEHQERDYSLCTEWTNLTFAPRCYLSTALLLELLTSYAFSVGSGVCFRPFDVSSDFYAPLENNGMAGNPLNLLRPVGWCMVALSFLAILCFILYSREVRRSMQRMKLGKDEESRWGAQYSHHTSLSGAGGLETPPSIPDELDMHATYGTRFIEWLPPVPLRLDFRGTPAAPRRLALDVPEFIVRPAKLPR